MVHPVLRAESMGRRFGKRQVLSAATLYAYPGRITLLLGRNGCGKSTLLKLIAGVVRADYGTVHFNQQLYPRPRLHLLARHGLFYIPERGLLTRYLTLEEHLGVAGATPTDPRVQEILRELALENFLPKFATQFSGGERRRADFALALLKQPLCLLADEPFQGIAPLDCDRLIRAIHGMRDRGAAIVVTGHEITPLFEIADEVTWMTGGTIHSLGNVSDARNHHQFCKEYLHGTHEWPHDVGSV